LEDTISKDVLKTFQDFYVQKDYANALLVLEKNQSDLAPGLWHYNVGTVKASEGRWAEARLHFLKARELGFKTHANESNLKLTEEKLEVGRLEKPLSTTDYLIKGALWAKEGAFTTISLLVLVIALWNLRRKKSFQMAAIYAVMMALPLLLNFWVNSWSRQIVIEPQLVQEGPSVIFGGKNELPAGVMVVTRHKGDWLEIIYPSRFAGWIKSAGLKAMENEHEL
jgi:hypothetical protein